jgi:hypothetical protein
MYRRLCVYESQDVSAACKWRETEWRSLSDSSLHRHRGLYRATGVRSESVGFRADPWCHTALPTELREATAVPQRSRGGPAKGRETSRSEEVLKRRNALVKVPIRAVLPGQGLDRIEFLNRESQVRFLPGAPIHTVVQKSGHGRPAGCDRDLGP